MKEKEKVGFWQVVGSTLLSFFGVSNQSIRERDFENGNPAAFFVTGIILAILFILAVYFVVQMVLPT